MKRENCIKIGKFNGVEREIGVRRLDDTVVSGSSRELGRSVVFSVIIVCSVTKILIILVDVIVVAVVIIKKII